MTDETNEQQPENNEAGVQEDANAEATQDQNPESEQPKDNEAEDTSQAGDESEDDKGEDDLPDWARQKLTKANTEAANYRVKLREAEEKLQNAKSLEEVDSIVNSIKTEREQAERALLVENVALKFKLPEKLQKRLSGSTREELEADAKELADLFGTEDDGEVTLEGGLTPRTSDPDANLSPRELAKKYRAKR